jgi:hypothetical protein
VNEPAEHSQNVDSTLRVAALLLGLAFLFGYAGSFTQLDIALGILLVLSLWALAGIAWWDGVRRDPILFAVVWGVVT